MSDGALDRIEIERVVPLADGPFEDEHLRYEGVDEAPGRGLDRGRATCNYGAYRRGAGRGGWEDRLGIRVAEFRAGAPESWTCRKSRPGFGGPTACRRLAILDERKPLDLLPYEVRQTETQREAASSTVAARVPETYQ